MLKCVTNEAAGRILWTPPVRQCQTVQGGEFRVYGVTNDVAVQTIQGEEFGV